jgi:hypothetical protein
MDDSELFHALTIYDTETTEKYINDHNFSIPIDTLHKAFEIACINNMLLIMEKIAMLFGYANEKDESEIIMNKWNNKNDDRLKNRLRNVLEHLGKSKRIWRPVAFEEEIIALYNYCEDHIFSYHIKDLCERQKSQNITVYRGQDLDNPIIENCEWFSCSRSCKIAYTFTGSSCCFFIIHVIDVPTISIESFPRFIKKDYMFTIEKEIIILGGGTFYKDSNLLHPYLPGEPWKEIDDTFEVYYSRKDLNNTCSNWRRRGGQSRRHRRRHKKRISRRQRKVST